MAKTKKAKPADKKRGPGWIERQLRFVFRILFRTIWWIGSRTALAGAAVLGLAVTFYFSTLPPVEDLLDGRERGSVVMQDRDGEVFAWRGDQFGGQIRVGEVSPHLKNAVIATEDKRFYSHFGVDPRGFARAMMVNFQRGKLVQGGSTITQQVAKNVFLTSARTIERKIKEIPLAIAMELRYTKEEILSIYMNRPYLGAGTYGFEAASQRYFGKSAREVNAAQAAMLAGLLKAPSSYSPTNDLSVAQGRAQVIVGLMEDQGYLDAAAARAARNNPAGLSPAAQRRAGGYFADWIMEEAPGFLSKDTTEDVQIKTTFDPRIQRAAEDALNWVFENKVRAGSKAQAAIVVMSPNGAVRAVVGGRQIGKTAGQFNRATQAVRQPGSAFKPFVYGAALETGWRPDSIVDDAPLTIDIPGSGPWSPKNYTNEYRGAMTLTEAMANSINTVAVRVSEETGRARVKAVAQDFGITGKLADGPALALGVSEVTLMELTGAYAGILNSGKRTLPYGLTKITLQGEDFPLFTGDASKGPQVLRPEAQQALIFMMNQVVETGSGQRAKLADRQAAGKTGTTQGARDAWFVGFTADYVAGVWMGYDDNSQLTNVTGGGLPAEIWKQTMTRVHEGLPATSLPMKRPSVAVAQNTERKPNLTGFESGRDSVDNPQPGRRRTGSGSTLIERIFSDLFN